MRKNRIVAAPEPEPEIFTDGGESFAVAVETEKAFFERIRNLDEKTRGQPPQAAIVTLSFESPDRLLEVLSPKRYELFKSVRERGPFASIGELAVVVQRDRSTVSKDVQELAAIGLLVLETVVHPGHGRSSSVSAVAKDIQIQFAL